jgi:hypothetical protein
MHYLHKIKELYKLDKKGMIPRLEKHEVHPDLSLSSRENYLYFFLSCSLNFQRNSVALWQSAFDTWNDKETNYVFFPEKVVTIPYKKFQKDMIKHKLALQKNKHPLIWFTLSKTLFDYYKSDPRELMKENNYSVENIVHVLQVKKKKLFPYMGGLKLSNYVLAILSWFTDLKLEDMHNLSIIPDTRVAQATVKLGILEGNPKPQQIVDAWRPLLKEMDIPPHEMHSILWHWSRNNFKPEV